MKEQSSIRWLIKRTAWIVSGENPYLVQKADRKSQLWHYFIGVFMSMVILVKITSLFIFFHSLIESIWISLTMSVLVSISIFNILRLLIISFSVPTIPVPFESGMPVYFSRLIRYSIVILLALFIAQPIAVYLFNEDLEPIVTKHRTEELEKLNQELNTMYLEEVATINEIIAYSNKADQAFYNNQLIEKEASHDKQLLVVSNLISNSNYFIYQIKQLHKQGSTEFILFQLFIVLLFYLPVLFKRRAQIFGNVQTLKKEHDMRLVSSEYERFKAQYNAILLTKYGVEPHEHEVFQDPPFNTTLTEKEYKGQKLFIREFRTNKDAQLGLGISKHYITSTFKAKFKSNMISDKQEFSLNNIYDIELVSPTEHSLENHTKTQHNHNQFNPFFKLVTAYYKTSTGIVSEKKEDALFLLGLEDVKIEDIDIEHTVVDIDEIHGTLKGKLSAELTYRDIDERLRINYIEADKQNRPDILPNKQSTAFPNFIKAMYLLPIGLFTIGLLYYGYTHSGHLFFVSFIILLGLTYARFKLHKIIKKKWIKTVMTIAIVLLFINVVAHSIKFLIEMVMSLF